MIILDRYEGDFAVLETGRGMINIPRPDLPAGAREGDVLKFIIDADTTKARKKHFDCRMNRLFRARRM